MPYLQVCFVYHNCISAHTGSSTGEVGLLRESVTTERDVREMIAQHARPSADSLVNCAFFTACPKHIHIPLPAPQQPRQPPPSNHAPSAR